MANISSLPETAMNNAIVRIVKTISNSVKTETAISNYHMEEKSVFTAVFPTKNTIFGYNKKLLMRRLSLHSVNRLPRGK